MIVRAVLRVEAKIAVGGGDLLGVAADVGVSLILAAGLIAATTSGSWIRPAGAVTAGVWCLLNFANYEHIRELGSMASLSNAGYVFDPTFFRGSVLEPTHPILLILTCFTSAILVWIGLGSDPSVRPIRLALAGAALIVFSAAMPGTSSVASWRRTDFVTAQTARLITQRADREGPAAVARSGLATRELDGSARLGGEPRAQNLLLVILEGVSGAYLPSLREHHAVPRIFDMPELDGIAQRALSYPSFVATQRQTNRGEYALLCGEYPKLLSSEATMTELVGRGPLDCLPRLMSEAGYSTVYLQAAPMPFMLKDQFMPQAGFEQVHGDDWFRNSYNRNHWGVDDRAFFEQSLEMIDELNQRSQPWFLTLLTVGTHHRYNVPPSFMGSHEPGTAAWAFEYLDRAIGEFVRQLEADGTLNNTLVLITSDESQAMVPGAPDAANMLTQGWGFLIALLPTGETGIVDEVFVQPDIPISVVDYFDLGKGSSRLTGRSVFRRYDRQRELFWGNTHLGMVAGLTIDGVLVICTEDFTACGARATVGSTLFSFDQPMRAAAGEEIEWLRDAALRSLTTSTGSERTRHFSLISRGPHPVMPTSGEQYLFGGQFLAVPAHSAADVEIEVEVTGTTGWIDLVHNFVVDLQPHYSKSVRLNAGETLRLGYAFNTDFDLDNVECRLWITDSQGDDLGLRFRTAELNITPLTKSRPTAEIVENVFEITRSEPD